jgi:hypothetical protein
MAVAARLDRLGQAQPIPVNSQRFVGRDDVNGIRFNRHAVHDLHDRHARMATDDESQFALMSGVQMQHDHEGETAVARHRIEKAIEGLDPACRGADANNRDTSAIRGEGCGDCRAPTHCTRGICALFRTGARTLGFPEVALHAQASRAVTDVGPRCSGAAQNLDRQRRD